MAKRDYYEILGVSREATPDEIKRAYRKLARETHPDLNPGDKKSEARFKEIQEAYDVLSDADKRQQFDRFGTMDFGQAGPGSRTYNYNWSNQGEPGVHFEFGEGGGLDDLLSGLFGGKAKRRGGGGFAGFGDAAGEDVQAEITVPFRTAALGGEMEISLSHPISQKLNVPIPAGVQDGARLRVAGKGVAPQGGKGKQGDLYLLVRVESHPYFKREGADIILEAPISVSEALLGANIDVPTLEGSVSVPVPAGASSGQKLRLRGKGGATRAGERGDQYVLLKVVVPKNIDAESRELIERFAKRNPQEPRQHLGW